MHAHFVVAGAGLCHKFLHITELFSFPCIQKYIVGFFVRSYTTWCVNRELYASMSSDRPTLFCFARYG